MLACEKLAVRAKEKQKRQKDMNFFEAVGYISKYGVEAYFDLPLK